MAPPAKPAELDSQHIHQEMSVALVVRHNHHCLVGWRQIFDTVQRIDQPEPLPSRRGPTKYRGGQRHHNNAVPATVPIYAGCSKYVRQ